jgi:hypothetical protein
LPKVADRTVAPWPIAAQPETPLGFFAIPILVDRDSSTNSTPPQIAFFKRDPDVSAWILHGVVDHQAGQHVVGAIHTNTIEGFWSLIKRGIVGSFHQVSRKYLPLYVAEFQFRYNNRDNPDIFGTAISGC